MSDDGEERLRRLLRRLRQRRDGVGGTVPPATEWERSAGVRLAEIERRLGRLEKLVMGSLVSLVIEIAIRLWRG